MSAEHVDKAIIRRIHDSINWGDVEWQDVIRIAYLAGRRDSQIQESDVSDEELADARLARQFTERTVLSNFPDMAAHQGFLAGLRVGVEQERERCAKIADNEAMVKIGDGEELSVRRLTAKAIAAAIRKGE